MTEGPGYDAPTRAIHLLLATFGVAALVSGQFAGDYRRVAHPGFDVHRWIGLALALALGLRLLWGFLGPRTVRFATWLPVTRARLSLVREDLESLLRLRLPLREEHQGLSALVQMLGLAAFLWMAVSGALLFAFLVPGTRAGGWIGAVKELHEAGQPVVIGYLIVHVGAVLAHGLAGDAVWRRIAPWRAR